MKFGKPICTVALAAMALSTACSTSNNDLETIPVATLVGRYAVNVGAGVSEIVAYHTESRSVFITVDSSTTPSSFQRISLRGLTSMPSGSGLTNPVTASNLESGVVVSVATHVNGTSFTAGGVQTLAISGNLLAIAVQSNPKTSNGVVAFYRLDAQGNSTYLKKVTVGSLPDGASFTPDGSKLVVANEGELSATFTTDGIDPLGTISIIAIANGTPADTATTLDFSAFNVGGARASELPTGVRIGRAAATVAQDIEPEFVSIRADGTKAYVTLQENNAVAVVDLATNSIERIFPMGYQDHSLAAKALAPSDQAPTTAPFVLKSYPNLLGIYMPDGIASFTANGTSYFITANEGDDRDDFLGTASAETARVSTLSLDSTAFPTATALELARLTVFKTMGLNSSNQFTKLYALGGRSFSIYNATTGTQIYDSGSDLEQRAYTTLPLALLSKSTVVGRLDNKGTEPESVVVGQVNGKTYAFVALERASAILMYDLSDPTAPKFIQWFQNTTDMANGDNAPEGLNFVPAAQSSTGYALLVVGNEGSGTLAVWEIK